MGQLSSAIDIEVPFYDVDALKVVWHGHYVKYFELARCKLLEKVGYTYDEMAVSGYYFPVIDLQVRYIKPIKFCQKITVTAVLVEWEHRLVIKYLITDSVSSERLTKAKTVQVAVAMPDQITQYVCPDVLIGNIEKALLKL